MTERLDFGKDYRSNHQDGYERPARPWENESALEYYGIEPDDKDSADFDVEHLADHETGDAAYLEALYKFRYKGSLRARGRFVAPDTREFVTPVFVSLYELRAKQAAASKDDGDQDISTDETA